MLSLRSFLSPLIFFNSSRYFSGLLVCHSLRSVSSPAKGGCFFLPSFSEMLAGEEIKPKLHIPRHSSSFFPGWLILCLLRLPRRRSRVSGSAQHFSSTRHSPNPSSIRSNKFIQYFFLLHYYRRSILGVIFLSFLFSPLEMQLWVFSFPDVSPAFRMCVLKPISRLAKWISECGETGLLPLVFPVWPGGSSNSTTQLLAREAELQLAALLGD